MGESYQLIYIRLYISGADAMKRKSKTDIMDDLKALFIAARHAYKGYTFEMFAKEAKADYAKYAESRVEPKTFSQWVNGQVMALSY